MANYTAKDATATAVNFKATGDGSGGSPFVPERAAVGEIAHDAADSGNPVKIGGKALSADPTAVATGDRANALFDLIGRLVVAPYTIPQNLTRGQNSSPITTTTTTQVVAAPAGSLRLFVTTVVAYNTSATASIVTLTDGSGGATLLSFNLPATSGQVSITLPAPLRLTAATALHAVCTTSGASVTVSVVGYTGV